MLCSWANEYFQYTRWKNPRLAINLLVSRAKLMYARKSVMEWPSSRLCATSRHHSGVSELRDVIYATTDQSANLSYISCSNGEKMVKIGVHLRKLLQNKNGITFWTTLYMLTCNVYNVWQLCTVGKWFVNSYSCQRVVNNSRFSWRGHQLTLTAR